MRKLLTTVLASLVTLLSLSAPALAQGPTLIQQTGTDLRSAEVCLNTRGAIPQSITIPAVGGKSFYIQLIDYQTYAMTLVGGTASSPGELTSTNIAGTPEFGAWVIAANAAGSSMFNQSYAYPNGLKSATSAAVVLSSGILAVAGVHSHINVCGYYAP